MKTKECIYKTKYLLFFAEQMVGKRTKNICIINRSSGNEIGFIEWYAPWRQYCFMPSLEFHTVWNNTCLTDIITVINKLMKERKIDKPKGE
jgi:hypothetical protein